MKKNKRNYNLIKNKDGLEEYIFMTSSGYRHFFVLGKNLKEAEKFFMSIEEIKRNNFKLEDLPIRLKYDKKKCRNWNIIKYWENNENNKI